MDTVAIRTLRRHVLARQGFASRPRRGSPGEVEGAIERLSCVQLDSISTVERSHRIVLAARVGDYRRGTVSDLLRSGRVFEYWAHEACLVPIADWPLFRYRIAGQSLNFLDRVVLRDEQGAPVVLDTMQGGTFADDHHLYISCGYYKNPHPSWGLHLFDMRTKRRIVRSTNGSGSFNYEFHPGGSTDEEPEGLTYWDLDRRNAPGIKGQLHAILLDNDANGDDVYFKHYRVVWS